MGGRQLVIEISEKMKGAHGSFFMVNVWRAEKGRNWFCPSDRMWTPL